MNSMRKLNGNGAAARAASKKWLRKQTHAQGVYDGPIRLLGIIVAIGVPLACYSAVSFGVTSWWPLVIGAATPFVIFGIRALVAYISKRRTPRPQRKQHPLTPLTNSDRTA